MTGRAAHRGRGSVSGVRNGGGPRPLRKQVEPPLLLVLAAVPPAAGVLRLPCKCGPVREILSRFKMAGAVRRCRGRGRGEGAERERCKKRGSESESERERERQRERRID